MAKASNPGKTAAGRGTLKSMRVTDGFRSFVLEQLAPVKSIRSRAMFGGVGLYCGDVFFGILAADALYLKTDDSNRPRYEEAGMPAFKPYGDKPMVMPYHQVPVGVLEDLSELAGWVKASVRVATVAKAPKEMKARQGAKAPQGTKALRPTKAPKDRKAQTGRR